MHRLTATSRFAAAGLEGLAARGRPRALYCGGGGAGSAGGVSDQPAGRWQAAVPSAADAGATGLLGNIGFHVPMTAGVRYDRALAPLWRIS